MNKEKGALNLILLLVVFAVVVAGGLVWYFTQSKSVPATSGNVTSTNVNKEPPVVPTTNVDTSVTVPALTGLNKDTVNTAKDINDADLDKVQQQLNSFDSAYGDSNLDGVN